VNNAIVEAFLTQNFLSPVKNWPKIFRRPRLFKVTDFDTNRKLMCDFLLVINTNLPPILYRFQVMDMSNFRQRQLASLWRFRWVITRNIGINFTSPVTIMIVLTCRRWRPHHRMSIRLSKTRERDGRTELV